MVDARMVRNPFWVPELRLVHRARRARCATTCSRTRSPSSSSTGRMRCCSGPRSDMQERGRDVLSLAVGCTGGRHRSVAIVEALAERLRGDGLDRHRHASRRRRAGSPALTAASLTWTRAAIVHAAGRSGARPAHAAARVLQASLVEGIALVTHHSWGDRDHASGRGARGDAGAACRTASPPTCPAWARLGDAQYVLVGIEPAIIADAIDPHVLQAQPPSWRIPRRRPPGPPRRRAVPRDRLRGRGRRSPAGR